jgi:hypothetical protein
MDIAGIIADLNQKIADYEKRAREEMSRAPSRTAIRSPSPRPW